MKPYLGMYVHMHWAYARPYAARTWTLDDWRGYLDGLLALGYNMVMIWPIADTMPDPLTPSDHAHLEKIRQLIDILHDEYDMAAMITFGPNCIGNEVAADYTFEDRPFFEAELRLNPGDPAELQRLIDFRRGLMRYLGKADGFVIIDSDPGGYVGSTNAEFVNLLRAHMSLVEAVNPAGTLYYWMWMGWERYNRFWAWTQDLPMPEERPIPTNFTEVLEGLLEEPERRWGVLSCNENHHPMIARYGIGDRVLYNPYNTVEYEPSIPLTNFAPAAIAGALALPEAAAMQRGVLANAQTHAVQLPHTYLFAHIARGGTPEDADLVGFAEGLLPGHGPALLEAWTAIGGEDVARLRRAAETIAAIAGPFGTDLYSGLLFGDPQRFLDDLAQMLRFRADMLVFAAAVRDREPWREPLAALHASLAAWTAATHYSDSFYGPVDDILYGPLKSLNAPALTPVLADLHDWKKVAGRHGIVHALLAAMEEVLRTP
jgi:hypothetical protein